MILEFSKNQINHIKQQALQMAISCNTVMLLDNNFCQNAFGIQNIEFAAAFGVKHELIASANCFDALEKFVATHHNNYVFTYFCYDLKNELEQLQSNHEDNIGFDSIYAFVPEQLLVIDVSGNCVVGQHLADDLLQLNQTNSSHLTTLHIQSKVTKADYLKHIKAIKAHILQGDVYELNYCIEFFANNAHINPYLVYGELIKKSPVPFAAFLKHNNKFLMCASPERFLTKQQQQIFSQPIKGTAARGINTIDDDKQKQLLLTNEKERAENLMIVDLVRNDLAKISQTGSVKVEELFGIYPFQQVFQMISTVSATVNKHSSFVEIIKQVFPMGSMTGAPKIMAMQLIEQYEQTKRGLYSGSVGYFAPNGNFDLNVVIRSIQYNANNNYLNFEVGSAITHDSVADEEYNECLLKAKAMLEVLNGI